MVNVWGPASSTSPPSSSPRGDRETLARILTPAGAVVVVVPRPDHLAEARAIYGGISVHEEKAALLVQKLAPAFALQTSRTLTFTLQLAGAHLADLLEMTPHRHHLDDEVLNDARRRTSALEVTAAVEIMVFRRP